MPPLARNPPTPRMVHSSTTPGYVPLLSVRTHALNNRQLCGEKEMLAQVKLAFVDPSGAKLVVNRNTSVTLQKSKKPSEKTLDLSLMRHANGERICLSKRQNELDVMVPQYLGVSHAVLDNVIFCHQDDSLWPMSQPAILKKKFDEIFEALKYTRAIANIKALRKNYMEDVRKLQVTELSCKANKDRADKVSRCLCDRAFESRITVFSVPRGRPRYQKKSRFFGARAKTWRSSPKRLQLRTSKLGTEARSSVT